MLYLEDAIEEIFSERRYEWTYGFGISTTSTLVDPHKAADEWLAAREPQAVRAPKGPSLEEIERNRERNKECNMTPEQIARRRERARERSRLVPLSPEQIECKRARARRANMTPEQIERERERIRKWRASNKKKAA